MKESQNLTTGNHAEMGRVIFEIPLNEIEPSESVREKMKATKLNPDKAADKIDIDFLSSIKTVGILQPITVTEVGEGYEIVSGDRRYIAAKRAKMQTIPAYCIDVTSEADFKKKAYHLNYSKPSKGADLAGIILSCDDLAGKKVREIASEYGVSDKLVNDALGIARKGEELVSLSRYNFKNAYYLKGYKPLYTKYPELLKFARNCTIEELKAKKKELQQKKNLDSSSVNSNATDITDLPEEKVYQDDRKVLFFKQLENFKGETIETEKLVSFLFGDIPAWN